MQPWIKFEKAQFIQAYQSVTNRVLGCSIFKKCIYFATTTNSTISLQLDKSYSKNLLEKELSESEVWNHLPIICTTSFMNAPQSFYLSGTIEWLLQTTLDITFLKKGLVNIYRKLRI